MPRDGKPEINVDDCTRHGGECAKKPEEKRYAYALSSMHGCPWGAKNSRAFRSLLDMTIVLDGQLTNDLLQDERND
jgi:hypothetical protein